MPHPSAESAYVSCAFCGSTSRIDGDRPEVTDASDQIRERARELSVTFVDAMQAAQLTGEDFLAVTHRLAAEHLGEVAEPQTLVNIVGNLVYDFEQEQSTRIREDAIAVGRVAELAFKAFSDIAKHGETEMNLPFITADASGPKHFLRKVNAQTFAELAASTPVSPENRAQAEGPAEAPAAGPAGGDDAAPKKKEKKEKKPKKGFFGRLFGD